MKKVKLKLFLGTIGIFLLLASFAVLVYSGPLIKDYVLAYGYRESVDVSKAAEPLSLTNYSVRLLKASNTQIFDAEQFNISCANFEAKETNRLLGCYLDQRIYVYNITNPELENSEDVTLAHELLHAGWDRMSAKQKLSLKNALEKQISSGISPATEKAISVYKQKGVSGDDLTNEIHSILGTDEPNLSPELEAHYQKFFKRRADIVNLSLGVNKVFEDVETEINSYQQSLNLLAAQIDDVQADIKLSNSEYRRLTGVADSKLNAGDYDGYNAMVGPINNLVAGAQELDAKQQQLISNYNLKVAKFNKLVEKYNLLDKSLDSKAAEKVEG
jgi:uncharacterized protein with NRDE domain